MNTPKQRSRPDRNAPIPISFLLDDTAPINLAFYLHPDQQHKLIIPNDLWEEFGDFCEEHGVKGKTSIVPYPSGIGRIDESLWPLPDGHLDRFLRIMRKSIARQFDITPELLTHHQVIDIKSDRHLHWYEDEWVALQNRKTIADYIADCLRILNRSGLRANGVTSPWSTGNRNESVYAAAISDALWRVNRISHTWYFLHVDTKSPRVLPKVTFRDRKHGRTVVSITSLCGDFIWGTMDFRTRREGIDHARARIEAVLSRDGARGRMRDLFRAGGPITFHSHAQSLFSNGTRAGLLGFKELILRIERTFGDAVRWTRCSEFAAACVQNCNCSCVAPLKAGQVIRLPRL